MRKLTDYSACKGEREADINHQHSAHPSGPASFKSFQGLDCFTRTYQRRSLNRMDVQDPAPCPTSQALMSDTAYANNEEGEAHRGAAFHTHSLLCTILQTGPRTALVERAGGVVSGLSVQKSHGIRPFIFSSSSSLLVQLGFTFSVTLPPFSFHCSRSSSVRSRTSPLVDGAHCVGHLIMKVYNDRSHSTELMLQL